MMAQLTSESTTKLLRQLLGLEPAVTKKPLADYLAAIPRLDSLANLASGTPVLVRGDVDEKPGAEVGQSDIRLRSMVETLKFGQSKGWKQIIFGHIGRDPAGSLEKVAKRIGQLLNCQVPLIAGWLDEATMTVSADAGKQIADAAPGAVIVLQNTRAYDIERVLWKAKEKDIPALTEKLTRFANEIATKIAKVYVNEALSAGSLDASTTVVPAAMDRVALGKYVAKEFEGPMMRCIEAQLVIFSGIKIDKLDDLEAMIQRGHIKKVISAGSLAMSLTKAMAQLDGGDFSLGVSEDPAHADKPYYIEPARIEQAKRMLAEGKKRGIEFILPADFTLADGSVKSKLSPGDQQFDIGPETSAHFAEKIGQFIDASKSAAKKPAVFHNGVFGMFEDPRFERGTKDFASQLKRMKDAGLEVYVGGGEGGKALEKYGQPDWVTHCFTAGGTVLNALGSEPIPYLVALKFAASR
jgi:phosphoglycerate kinase